MPSCIIGKNGFAIAVNLGVNIVNNVIIISNNVINIEVIICNNVINNVL